MGQTAVNRRTVEHCTQKDWRHRGGVPRQAAGGVAAHEVQGQEAVLFKVLILFGNVVRCTEALDMDAQVGLGES